MINALIFLVPIVIIAVIVPIADVLGPISVQAMIWGSSSSMRAILASAATGTDPMGVDSDRRSDRVRLQTSHSGDEHASYSRSTRSAERYP
jgi:hypothetical protein